MIHTGPVMVRPWYFNSTMSSVTTLCCVAVVGLIQTALSQVILFWGLGNSCSQPLLANDPSQMVGSGRNRISIPCACWAAGAGGALAVTLAVARALLGTTPSCRAFCQKMSKDAPAAC